MGIGFHKAHTTTRATNETRGNVRFGSTWLYESSHSGNRNATMVDTPMAAVQKRTRGTAPPADGEAWKWDARKATIESSTKRLMNEAVPAMTMNLLKSCIIGSEA
eukprot:6478684-Prymnesium_polylepis.3